MFKIFKNYFITSQHSEQEAIEEAIDEAQCLSAATEIHTTVEQVLVEKVQVLVEKVHKLLASGERNVNTVDKDGRTLLHYAVLNGCVAAVQLLIDDARCDLNVRDALGGYAPLHLSFIYSKPIFKLLMGHPRCDVNLPTGQSRETILHFICSSASTTQKAEEILPLLLQNSNFTAWNNRARDDMSALMRVLKFATVANISESCCRMLIESGLCDLCETDSSESSLLLVAVHAERYLSAAALLDSPQCPSIINLKGQCGMAPLHFLLLQRSPPEELILKMIEIPSCNLNLPTWSVHQTPLYLAIQWNHVRVAEAIIQSGRCDLKAELESGNSGNTPLHYACEYFLRNNKMLHMLLKINKFDVNQKNNAAETPLVFLMKSAISLSNLQQTVWLAKLQLLIEYGADVEAVVNGETLNGLFLAVRSSRHLPDDAVARVLDTILSAGADTSSPGAKRALSFFGSSTRPLTATVLLREGVTFEDFSWPVKEEEKVKRWCNIM